MAADAHEPSESPRDLSAAIKLSWRAFWHFAKEHVEANLCLALAFILPVVVLIVHGLILGTEPDDPKRLSSVLSWLVSRPGFVWALMASGALTCCAFIWVLISWQRHVVHALREVTRQIAEEPANAGLYWARGWIYLFEIGLAAPAVSELTQAIRLEPNSWDFYDDRADAHVMAGNVQQAILDRTSAIAILAESGELAAEHWWLYACRASDHVLAGDDERAIADLTEAIRLLAVDPEAKRAPKAMLHYQRAMAHQRSGDAASARQDLLDAHRDEPLWRLDPRWWCIDIVPLIWGFICAIVLWAFYFWLSS
jgi:tetratricopeptide (TPR) repeat protein